jgi:hypothetical protein
MASQQVAWSLGRARLHHQRIVFVTSGGAQPQLEVPTRGNLTSRLRRLHSSSSADVRRAGWRRAGGAGARGGAGGGTADDAVASGVGARGAADGGPAAEDQQDTRRVRRVCGWGASRRYASSSPRHAPMRTTQLLTHSRPSLHLRPTLRWRSIVPIKFSISRASSQSDAPHVLGGGTQGWRRRRLAPRGLPCRGWCRCTRCPGSTTRRCP